MLIIFRKNWFRIEKQKHYVSSDPNKILIYNLPKFVFVLINVNKEFITADFVNASCNSKQT